LFCVNFGVAFGVAFGALAITFMHLH
jgi:hypothetical protein